MKEVDLIALAAFLHDIGKFGQRAEITLTKDSKLYNYTHAAFSAEILERYKNIFGLSDEEIDYAAMHHNLKENMDDEYWIVAVADRLASGFEREVFKDYELKSKEFEGFKKQKLKSIFDENKEYKIDKLASLNIFSSNENGSYKKLWEEFIKNLQNIKQKTPQVFDYLYKKYTTFIPSSTSFKLKEYKPVKANIPLYDHSKTAAVFASVIYELVKNGEKSVIDYYKYGKKEDFEKENFLLIAGDFFGIQNFIFDRIKSKYASKMLRAKSAYVEILTKLAAFYIVKKLDLSYFSIISATAGKFEILAPNLEYVKNELENIKKEFDEFFKNNFFAATGIGIIEVECGIKDFIREEDNIPYRELRKKIADKIELMKMEKFNNLDFGLIEYEKDINNQNLCEFCEIRKGKKEDEYVICDVCKEFVEIGKNLATKEFLSLKIGDSFKECKIEFNKKGDYVFDISKSEEFRGFEKWEISSYVAIKDDFKEFEVESDYILTFEDLAKLSCLDGIENGKRKMGVEAIGVFKADVDFMGNFIQGLSENAKKINVTASFSKFNFFSRLINYFFSVYAPYLMQTKFKRIYTIFAGGDDLFIVGSWDEVIEFSKSIREDFIRFCENQMKLSGGFVMTKPNKPINFIARVVEEAEKEAKDYKKEQEYLNKEKNAICMFNETISFDLYDSDIAKKIEEVLNENKEYFSTAFLYKLLEFVELSKNISKNPLNSMWISRYEYSFRRNLEEKYKRDFEELKLFLKSVIEENPELLKIKLHEFIYKRRKNG